MKPATFPFLFLILILGGIGFFPNACPPASAQSIIELLSPPRPTWPPEGVRTRIPISRDTSLSSVGEEKRGGNGGAERYKLKGPQEIILMDADLSPLKGKIITGALLYVRSASARTDPLARVGVSAVASDWAEGKGKNYQVQEGTSSFTHAFYGKREWAYPGSSIMDVIFGHGNTLWKFADCSAPDADGWQTCAVDPNVLAARLSGLSYGFSLYDEVGSIWSIEKGRFSFSYFPNRFCYSRESKESAPWLEIWTKNSDSIPPEPIKYLEVETAGLPPGEALVRWKTPKDIGGGKTLGFLISYRLAEEEKEIPRYLIPMAGREGEEVVMHLQDLSFLPGQSLRLTLKAVDSAGNISNPLTQTIHVASSTPAFSISPNDLQPFDPDINLPQVGGLKVAIVDLLDKIEPRSGAMNPPRKAGYKGGNHIYSAKKKLIRLQSARNETVCFQLNLAGVAPKVSVQFGFDHHRNLKPRLFQFAYVSTEDSQGKGRGFLPDPLLPVAGPVSIPSAGGQVKIPDQQNLSLICEVYIPHEEPAGRKKGRVIIGAGQEKLELEVDLTVWNFTLPNKLSFVPEMNAYGTTPLYHNPDYYRLAHEHRTCLNWLPYGWHGLPAFAPGWKGDRFEWTDWDRKAGPLLDGSAFQDLPRKEEPVDVFYLPFSENWPVNLFDHYRPTYWAEEAFTPQYREELWKAFAAFATHVEEKKWHDTIFHFYLNNKVYNRKSFPRNSAPWIFDEPVNTQDFWALRWYGILWQSAVKTLDAKARMWYRGDVSYTQFGRNILWGVMDVEYVGDNDPQKVRMKRDEKTMTGRGFFAEYGTANRIEDPNTQPVIWCMSAWSKGASGVLPWQTLGSQNSWKSAEQTALFYPSPDGPRPSVRLKAFSRGQQDVEYLTLLADVFKIPRHLLAGWLRDSLNLEGIVQKTSAGDAGTPTFRGGDVEDLWNLRCRIGKMLSDSGPAYRRALVRWEKKTWDEKKLPPIGYVSAGPAVQSYRPACDRFKP